MGWKDIVWRIWIGIGRENIALLAAGVAFYAFLACVPLLASIVLVYRLFADPAVIASHIAYLDRALPPDAAHIIADQLQNIAAVTASSTLIGLLFAILLAIYGAMRGATSTIAALNVAYREQETRSLIRTYGLALILTVGTVIVGLILIVAIGFLSILTSDLHVSKDLGSAPAIASWMIQAALLSAMIAALYRYGPDRRPARWSWLTTGAVFASLGSQAGTFLFGLYVAYIAHYNATYGALGAVVSLLMWLYMSAYVLLIGALLNAEIEHQIAHDSTIGPARPPGLRGAEMADRVAVDEAMLDRG